MMNTFANRRDTSELGRLRRQRFGEILDYMESQGISREWARTKLLRVLHVFPAVFTATLTFQPFQNVYATTSVDLTKNNLSDVITSAAQMHELSRDTRLTIKTADGKNYEYVIDARQQTPISEELKGHLSGDPNLHALFSFTTTGSSVFVQAPDGQIIAMSDPEVKWTNEADTQSTGSDVQASTASNDVAATSSEGPSIEVNIDKVASAQPGELIAVNIPGIGDTSIQVDQNESYRGSSQFVGHLAGYDINYPVVIRYTNGDFEGNAETPEGAMIIKGTKV